MNRVARSLTTILAILGLALLIPVGSVAVSDCSLTVTPKTGVPGTAFVFKGKGFTPTVLTLTRGSDETRVAEIPAEDISGTSFRYKLFATDESEVGKWRAVAAGCPDSAIIRVTLPPTATEVSATTTTPAPDDTMQLAGLTLLGVLFLSATALLLPRLTRAARAG